MTDDKQDVLNEVNYYPIDVDTLNKGDTFTIEQCERLTSKAAHTDAYRFSLLSIKDFIIRESLHRGRPLSAAIRGDRLCILKDSEAVQHHYQQVKRGRRGIGRHSRFLVTLIDPAALTADEQEDYRRKRHLAAMMDLRLSEGRRLPANPNNGQPAIEGKSNGDRSVHGNNPGGQ